jgi:hypothetical protein
MERVSRFCLSNQAPSQKTRAVSAGHELFIKIGHLNLSTSFLSGYAVGLQWRKFLVPSVHFRAYKFFTALTVLLSSKTGAVSMGCLLLQLVHDILFLLASFSCQPSSVNPPLFGWSPFLCPLSFSKHIRCARTGLWELIPWAPWGTVAMLATTGWWSWRSNQARQVRVVPVGIATGLPEPEPPSGPVFTGGENFFVVYTIWIYSIHRIFVLWRWVVDVLCRVQE